MVDQTWDAPGEGEALRLKRGTAQLAPARPGRTPELPEETASSLVCRATSVFCTEVSGQVTCADWAARKLEH